MFCKECGEQCGDTDKFCWKCGAKLPEKLPIEKDMKKEAIAILAVILHKMIIKQKGMSDCP